MLFSAVASADRNLPVLFSYSQPSHSVAIYRGADLVKAQAAGLFGGLKTGASSGAGDSSSYATPAPPTYPTTTTAAPTTTTTAAPTPAPYTPAPYTPAPVAYKPIEPIRYRPAPKVYKPAPVVYKPAPAPIVYRPAPVVYKPAPVVYKPAPVAYKPAPVAYKPAPVAYKPAPAAYKPYVDEYAAVSTFSIFTKKYYLILYLWAGSFVRLSLIKKSLSLCCGCIMLNFLSIGFKLHIHISVQNLNAILNYSICNTLTKFYSRLMPSTATSTPSRTTTPATTSEPRRTDKTP